MTTTDTAAAVAEDPTFALLDAHTKAEARVFGFTYRDGDLAGERQLTAFMDELHDIARDIAHNEPLSIAGVAAVLRFVSEAGPDPECGRWPLRDVVSEEDADWLRTLHTSLAAALERIAHSQSKFLGRLAAAKEA